MFNKKKEDKKKLLELYQARYDEYMLNGIHFDPEQNKEQFIVPGKFGDLLMIHFGKKIHADTREITDNFYFEGEVEVAGERIYLCFKETDFIKENDVFYEGFIKDNDGLRILPMNLSDKEFSALFSLKLDVLEHINTKMTQAKQESVEVF